jgi:hypothetical protein
VTGCHPFTNPPMSAHTSPRTSQSPPSDDWDTLATSHDGLAVHLAALDADGEIDEIACNNNGGGWTPLDDKTETETHRICRTCLRAATGANSPLATPQLPPIEGVEMVSAFRVRVTGEDR